MKELLEYYMEQGYTKAEAIKLAEIDWDNFFEENSMNWSEDQF